MAVTSRLGSLVLGAVLLGCSPAAPGVVDDDDSPDVTTPEPGDGPEVIEMSPVATPGGHLYVLTADPMSTLQIELAGEVLTDSVALRADWPGALFRVPSHVPVGTATLAVRRVHEPNAVTEEDIELVEPSFADVAEPTGLAQVHDATGSPAECAESHTGLAYGDYDGDGEPDLFVGNVGAPSHLHHNLGLTDSGLPEFEDATTEVGLEGIDAVAMATFVDLEGDGDLDLFVGRRGPNRMFRNRLIEDGQARFEDITEAVGLGVYDQRTMGVAFGDYDADGDLDLYVVNHAFCFPRSNSEVRAGDHLYRNDDGVFHENTMLLDFHVLASVGFSASWVDVERDGDLDLIVINDDVGGEIGNPNALWRNDGPGSKPGSHHFTDRSLASGIGIPRVNGMGLALGDVNDDGFVDLAFSNIGDNVLLLNAGDGTFVDVSEQAGIRRGRMPWDRPSITWATHLWDYDNDGDLDLYFSGGRIKGVAPIVDAFFHNRGDGTFENLTWASGLTDPASGKASALVDLDRDGLWELTTTAWSSDLRVYRNRSAELGVRNHWLDIELEGRGGNRDAIGAIVELRTAAGTRTCFHTNRPSQGAGGETPCHFGLGEHDRIESLRIEWPDGSISEPTPPAVDQRIRLVQDGS